MKKAKKDKKAALPTGITAKVSVVAASLHTVTLSYIDNVDSGYFEAHRGVTGTLTFKADKPPKA